MVKKQYIDRNIMENEILLKDEVRRILIRYQNIDGGVNLKGINNILDDVREFVKKTWSYKYKKHLYRIGKRKKQVGTQKVI